MKFALIGQPNCGKSTLFNQIAGYKAETGNFSGTTVTFTESKVRTAGEIIDLVDLPGTYTLAGTNPAEREVFNYLASNDVDLIIIVLDASRLIHGLELVLEILELKQPVVIALNMMDEAKRIGLDIDIEEMELLLNVPVVPIIARIGQGIKNLFSTAVYSSKNNITPDRIHYAPDIENSIEKIASKLNFEDKEYKADSVAIKLLENDPIWIERITQNQPELLDELNNIQTSILESRGKDACWVIGGERHILASKISSETVIEGERVVSWQDRIDDILLHPVWGYLALIAVMFLFFQFVYYFGSALEGPLLSSFDFLENWLTANISGGLFEEILKGLVQGISGGLAIVFPYLVPFLFGLGLLEDIGYLPRVAFLTDSLLHRLGLHGKAIVPFILGYGCNVPAVMSTRIMEEKRDRFLAATLATLVPCAARIAVVFGLVAFYVGPNLALGIYVFNILVISVTAKILTSLLPEDSPGLILEMPVYRMPTVRTLSGKAWFRIKEFIFEAWPILIVGSIILAIFNFFHWDEILNIIAWPISWVLGLPKEVGLPLIFGVLRKELSLVMLRQALNTQDLSTALTSIQMVTFSVFVVFYVPCLATLVTLRKELGTRAMITIAFLTIIIAIITALIARGAVSLFL